VILFLLFWLPRSGLSISKPPLERLQRTSTLTASCCLMSSRMVKTLHLLCLWLQILSLSYCIDLNVEAFDLLAKHRQSQSSAWARSFRHRTSLAAMQWRRSRLVSSRRFLSSLALTFIVHNLTCFGYRNTTIRFLLWRRKAKSSLVEDLVQSTKATFPASSS